MLGDGGVKLFEKINWLPDVYHMNESHDLPLAFNLYKKYKDLKEIENRLRFTNHTPEPGGNEKTDFLLLQKFGYFNEVPSEEIKKIAHIENDFLDHTGTAVRMSGRVNAVSKLHFKTLKSMWKEMESSNKIISITNAKNFNYWADDEMYKLYTKMMMRRWQKEKENANSFCLKK